MRKRTHVLSALIAVSILTVGGSSSAQAASTAKGYQRVTVEKAGISILVPRHWRIIKGGGSSNVRGRCGRYVSVGISPGYGSSLPSQAEVRAYLANLARRTGGPFDRVTVERTAVADTPAIVQSVVLSENATTVTHLFQARLGQVIHVVFARRRATDPEFDDMTDAMIRGVRLVS